MAAPEKEHERRDMTTAARRYYLEDATKVEIAAELGISRFKVARLLQQARERGVVRIEITPEYGLNHAVAQRLRSDLGLREAVVVDPNGSRGSAAAGTSAADRSGQLRREVGRCAAHLLERVITGTDVLGLPSSRTVAAMVAELRELPPVQVVQLSGALTGSDAQQATPIDVVREAARIGGGGADQFFAPLVATDRDSAQMLRRQPSVATAFARVDEVTLAVVGIGAWAEGESTLFGSATEAEHAELLRAGVVGEISGVFIDAAGDAVGSDITDRIISVDRDQLRGIPHVIGLAVGSGRAAVVRAAVAGGLVQSLVCDRDLAVALLDS
ncbi:sugar-binding transcriptional regulator [Dermacoccaceae bacterium W4C1]